MSAESISGGGSARPLRESQLPVILLAAGEGKRLRPLTEDRPKAMVEVGGEPLATRAIRTLAEAGFDRVVAVTGYRSETMSGLGCGLLHNERWRENNVVSLWAARELVEGGFYLVNSDVLFERAIAERLATESGSFVLADPSHALDAEAMKALVAGERLTALSKAASNTENAGEYIGLLRVDPDDGPRLAEILDELVASGQTDLYYEDAIAALAQERPVRVVSVAGLAWAEIDDHDDLARAEREVLARV